MAARVVCYREDDGTVPVRDWLNEMPPKAVFKCLVRLKRLEQLGHELRRPEADYLRDGIYELRASHQRIHYRMLYFFHQQDAIVVSHGLAKERIIPPREIELALRRKQKFEAEPELHKSPMET